MRTTRNYLIIITLLILSPLLQADMGPKPSENYRIKFEIAPIPTLEDYTIFICENPECNESHEMGEKGWGWVECTQFKCTSITYGDYFFISLSFDDGITRKSNGVTKKYFYSKYTITVFPDELVLKEIGGLPDPYISAIVCFGILIISIITLVTRLIINGFKRKKHP